MQIIKDGRGPFLEFLRNLGPQAVVLAFALVAGRKLEPTCCYFENTKETVIFICFLLIFVASAWANSSLFVQRYLVSADRINQESERLVKNGVTELKNLGAIVKFALIQEPLIFVELVVVFVIVEFGLVVVIMTAVNSANVFVKVLQG